MPDPLVIYTDPLSAAAVLTPDDGRVYTGTPYTHASGRQGQQFAVDAGSLNMGAQLTITADGFYDDVSRGLLVETDDGVVHFEKDDFRLTPKPTAPPEPI